MSTGQQVKDAQKRWAESRGLHFRADYSYYLDSVEAGLWKPLSDCARKAFEEGGGGELKDGSRPAKMKALHSSSALEVNFFDYWTTRDKAPLLKAMGIDGDSAESLCFEAKFPTSLRGQPPNLDVATKLCSGDTIGIESKFTERMTKKTKATKSSERFAEKYFPCRLWEYQKLPECQRLAEEVRDGIQNGEYLFNFLDVEQLLKHALGLATQLGDKFRLYYLYYDSCTCERSKAHKKEIDDFAARVGDEIRFRAISYQKLYHRLPDVTEGEEGYKPYIDYLGERYFNNDTCFKSR